MDIFKKLQAQKNKKAENAGGDEPTETTLPLAINSMTAEEKQLEKQMAVKLSEEDFREWKKEQLEKKKSQEKIKQAAAAKQKREKFESPPKPTYDKGASLWEQRRSSALHLDVEADKFAEKLREEEKKKEQEEEERKLRKKQMLEARVLEDQAREAQARAARINQQQRPNAIEEKMAERVVKLQQLQRQAEAEAEQRTVALEVSLGRKQLVEIDGKYFAVPKSESPPTTLKEAKKIGIECTKALIEKFKDIEQTKPNEEPDNNKVKKVTWSQQKKPAPSTGDNNISSLFDSLKAQEAHIKEITSAKKR
eukprot:m.135444 g.135444  ORF g.135444 m.135444 type:complete len:308 (-) comp29793_c2_seq1:271-1194(-)